MTSGTETRNTEILTRLLTAWTCRKFVNTLDPSKTAAAESDVYVTGQDEDMISKIIWKRTEKYGLKLPFECAYMISLGSNGNPGIAIIMYYTLLERIVERRGAPIPHDYIITSEDFANAFPMSFPDMDDPTQKKQWEKAWDNQKNEAGHNNVDKVEYWDKLFV